MDFPTIYFLTGIFVSTSWSVGLGSSYAKQYVKEFDAYNKNNENNLSDITEFVSNKINTFDHWFSIFSVFTFWPPFVYNWVISKLAIYFYKTSVKNKQYI